MACIGGQARKLGPKEPEFFVRKMVCQDDNAPEVRTNISGAFTGISKVRRPTYIYHDLRQLANF